MNSGTRKNAGEGGGPISSKEREGIWTMILGYERCISERMDQGMEDESRATVKTRSRLRLGSPRNNSATEEMIVSRSPFLEFY